MIINENCPCKRKKCERHGKYDECRKHHAESERQRPVYCEKKKKEWRMKTPVFESFQKNTCKTTKTMLTYRQQKKRWKRLLSSDVDRNTASPTESAVWKRRQREHSGADWLNRILQDKEWELAKHRVGQYVWYALNIKSGKVVIAMIFQCGWYRGNIEEWDPAPEQWNVPGRFFISNFYYF